jgi:hypothetical protein
MGTSRRATTSTRGSRAPSPETTRWTPWPALAQLPRSHASRLSPGYSRGGPSQRRLPTPQVSGAARQQTARWLGALTWVGRGSGDLSARDQEYVDLAGLSCRRCDGPASRHERTPIHRSKVMTHDAGGARSVDGGEEPSKLSLCNMRIGLEVSLPAPESPGYNCSTVRVCEVVAAVSDRAMPRC